MGLLKTWLRRMLLVVALAGIAVFLQGVLKSPSLGNPAQVSISSANLHKKEATKEKIITGLPVRLQIPKISVDAPLDYVSITPQGELGVPKSPADAAWYDLGPRPGEKGNAVIDGHFGYKNHIPAVFDNLHMLQKGDGVYVKDEKGLTSTFTVRELRTYGQNEDDIGVFVSNDGKAHLNLITCQGVWNQKQQRFPTRLVVFTDKKVN